MKLETYDGFVKVKRAHVKDYCEHFGLTMKEFKRSYTFDEVEWIIGRHWPAYIPSFNGRNKPADNQNKAVRRLYTV